MLLHYKKQSKFNMNAIKQIMTITSSSSVIRRSASTMYRNRYFTEAGNKYTDYNKKKLNKDLESYMESRRKRWSDFHRKIGEIKRGNKIDLDREIIEWETEKALEHTFKN